jgi:hypothetical protein
MPVTQLGGKQVLDQSIDIDDLNTTTIGKSVITKIIPGNNIQFTSTGADAGTGVVTINLATLLLDIQRATYFIQTQRIIAQTL